MTERCLRVAYRYGDDLLETLQLSDTFDVQLVIGDAGPAFFDEFFADLDGPVQLRQIHIRPPQDRLCSWRRQRGVNDGLWMGV